MGLIEVIGLLGGIALFLFGMNIMGDGLKRVAGNKLEVFLYKLSSTPLKGLLLGTGVTAVIQSSGATSIMAVGFVNSGIMKLEQAISVIMGSIIGTSVTGWIICLSYIEGNGWTAMLSSSVIAAVIAVIGIVLRMFSKKKVKQQVGDILLGFAVLMFGMQYMSSSVEPLRENEKFLELITAFSNPALGILAGMVFAAVLQSASAAVGILQAIATTGAVTFDIAWPVLLGICVGASVPVLMSSIGAKADGKRASLAYLLISLFSAVFCGIVYYVLNAIFSFGIGTKAVNAVEVAALNTEFRAAASIVLLPFVYLIAKLLRDLIKTSNDEMEVNEDLDRLDERFINHPSTAIEQSRIAIYSMANKTRKNIFDAFDLLDNYTEEGFARAEELENYIDKYEDKIGAYLLKLNTQALNKKENSRVSEYVQVLTDFERISDHAYNIAQSAQEIYSKKITFSEDGQKEIETIIGACKEVLNLAVDAFIAQSYETALKVEPLEDYIDYLCDELKARHVMRMRSGKCSMNVGFVYNDLLGDIERVGDHSSNIALAIIDAYDENYDNHERVKSLQNEKLYEEYSKKYALGEISQ